MSVVPSPSYSKFYNIINNQQSNRNLKKTCLVAKKKTCLVAKKMRDEKTHNELEETANERRRQPSNIYLLTYFQIHMNDFTNRSFNATFVFGNRKQISFHNGSGTLSPNDSPIQLTLQTPDGPDPTSISPTIFFSLFSLEK